MKFNCQFSMNRQGLQKLLAQWLQLGKEREGMRVSERGMMIIYHGFLYLCEIGTWKRIYENTRGITGNHKIFIGYN
jgi:hypothetical protein